MTLVAALVLLAPSRVEIRPAPGDKFTLIRNGRPYFVKGAGVSDSTDDALRRLKEAGGNSVRTWGVGDDTGALLDLAHKHGLTVLLGFWLGHKQHGFDWTSPKMTEEQFAKVREGVRKFKDHPALLAYSLGNEMEMGEPRDELWKEVGRLAEMVKREDPRHPVGTVVAEIGGNKIAQMMEFAPALEFVGINSYGGMDTLPKRLAESGWRKPFLVTEFGPSGPWEVGKTSWGATLEPTSTVKAELYERRYTSVVKGMPGLALGSYAFLWGHKMEETATWFGMHLPSGEATSAVDVMSRYWKGRSRRDTAPTLASLGWSDRGEGVFKTGESVKALAAWSDREGATTIEWFLRRDGKAASDNPNDAQAEFALVPGVTGPVFAAPAPGRYRLFLTVRDGKGNAATGNLPMLVR